MDHQYVDGIPWSVYSLPLLQIIEIEINAPEGKDTNTSEILLLFGKIFVKDETYSYLLYEQDDRVEKSVSFSSSLKLNGSRCVLPASPGMHLRVELNGSNSYLHKTVLLNVDAKDKHEKSHTCEVKGDLCKVVIKYLEFQCAVPGVLSVELKNLASKPELFNGGKLLAWYGDTYEVESDKCPQFELHHFTMHNLEPSKPKCLELDCNRVAVPSYSSLSIKFVPHDGGEETSFTFKPSVCRLEHFSFSFGVFSLRVEADWFWWMLNGIPTRQLPLNEDGFLFDSDDEEGLDAKKYAFKGNPVLIRRESETMAEVFSILIVRQGNQEVRLFGTIKLLCSTGEWILFNREENEAQVLKGSEKMLRIESSEMPLVASPLYFLVDLKDTLSSLRIKGCNSWDEPISVDNNYIVYDRRLLDVYVGNSGYAAVHYMVISDAYSATIEVEAIGQDITEDVTAYVQGSIYASYGIHSYDTDYDREFYRSCLFKDDDSARELTVKEGKCEIPLRRKFVSVDYRSSLFLDIDVAIGIGKEKTNEVVFKREGIEFKPPRPWEMIKCQDKYLRISVTWNCYPERLQGWSDFS